VREIERKTSSSKQAEDGDASHGDGEDPDSMFRIIIEKPWPELVKLSRKNIAYVTINQGNEVERAARDNAKLIEFFMNTKKPTWASQFKNAVLLGPQIDEEDMIVEEVTLSEGLTHFFTITWKVLFACVPPCQWGTGYPAFLIALCFIGGVTAIVSDVASMIGCCVGLPDSVTAITLVALGTSLPDTFASMTACQNSDSADSAVGNVTGSNSVNVFLGLGLPWLIASRYQENLGKQYITPPGDLSYSVSVFVVCSLVCFLILGVRRCVIGGELGGPRNSAYASAAMLIGLWLIYVILSIIKATSGQE